MSSMCCGKACWSVGSHCYSVQTPWSDVKFPVWLFCCADFCCASICNFWINQQHFPHCSGYGDLWDDIQNLHENENDNSARDLSVSSEENSGVERNEGSSEWRRSEEEENGDEGHNADHEDKEEERGTV